MKQTVLKQIKNASEKNVFEFTLNNDGRLRLSLINEKAVRFQLSYDSTFPGTALNRYGFIHNLQKKFKIKKSVNKNEVIFDTGKIKIILIKKPLRISIEDKDGNILFKQAKETTLGGKDGFKAGFEIRPQEEFFGFGDQTRKHLTQRGKKADLYVRNVASYIPVPFFMSTSGYGIFVNTTYHLCFDMGSIDKNRFTFQAEKGAMDFYFFYGPSFNEILSLYTDLTGRPSLPPLWSFGLWFICRTQANDHEVISDCLNFRREKIPCDVIALEPGWTNKHYDYSTEKNWDPERFPVAEYAKLGPNTMVSAIKRMGFKLALWECNDYDISFESERQVGKNTKKDLSLSTNHRPVWAKNGEVDEHFNQPIKMDKITIQKEPWFEHHKQFIDQGVDFFKQDGSNQVLSHPDRLWGNSMTDDEMHNLYPLLYSKQMYEGFLKYTNRRPCCFTPAGWAGLQRYTGTWTGDTGGKENTLVAILNMSFCGHSWSTCDMEATMPEGIHFGFLQAWSQLNSWNYWRHPWLLGDNVYPIFKFYANLRSSLLPYIYSYAYIASQTGMPVIRPMVLEFPEDRSTYNLTRAVYVWKRISRICFYRQSLFARREMDGLLDRQSLHRQEMINYIPPPNRGGGLFMRSGSIVPRGPVMDYTGQVPVDKIYLEIFPEAKNGKFLLYEDDGISLEHENGKLL